MRRAFHKYPALVSGLAFDKAQMDRHRADLQSEFLRYGPTKSNVNMSLDPSQDSAIVAGISPESWDVTFKLRPGLRFKPYPELLTYLQAHGITQVFSDLLINVGDHEIGHWEFPRGSGFGCPYDKVTYYTDFVDVAMDVATKVGGMRKSAAQAFALRMANTASDVIDNFNVAQQLRSRNRDYCGQALFWYMEGQQHGRFDPEYELFVRLNLVLSFSDKEKHLLDPFMRYPKALDVSLNKLVTAFTPDAMKDMAKWPDLVRTYCLEALKWFNPGKQSHRSSASSDQSGKGHDRQTGTELSGSDIEKIVLKRGADATTPFYLDRTTGLDAYYKALAREVKLRTDATRIAAKAKMNVVPVTLVPFDPDQHDPRDVNFARLHLDPVSRRIVPSVVGSRMGLDIPITRERKNLPSFMFTLIDTSWSMMGTSDKFVPWGTNSSYHYALLTFYGLLRFFEKEHILHKIDFSGAIFSNKTLGAQNLQEIKEIILNPATGGTTLDMAEVVRLMRGRHGAVFLMISDGGIANWSRIKDDFIEVAKQNEFAMIQIGGWSNAATDLKSSGLNVQQVNSAQDVVGLALDWVGKKYQVVIQEGDKKEAKKYV